MALDVSCEHFEFHRKTVFANYYVLDRQLEIRRWHLFHLLFEGASSGTGIFRHRVMEAEISSIEIATQMCTHYRAVTANAANACASPCSIGQTHVANHRAVAAARTVCLSIEVGCLAVPPVTSSCGCYLWVKFLPKNKRF